MNEFNSASSLNLPTNKAKLRKTHTYSYKHPPIYDVSILIHRMNCSLFMNDPILPTPRNSSKIAAILPEHNNLEEFVVACKKFGDTREEYIDFLCKVVLLGQSKLPNISRIFGCKELIKKIA